MLAQLLKTLDQAQAQLDRARWGVAQAEDQLAHCFKWHLTASAQAAGRELARRKASIPALLAAEAVAYTRYAAATHTH